MSGGYFNHVGFTVNDALTGVAENERVRRRWPTLSSLLVAIGAWFHELEHTVDWDLSGDRAIENDARWERKRIVRILEDVMRSAPDDLFPRGKWATIQAFEHRAAGAVERDQDGARLLQLATQRREFVTFEDGYVYYCPSEARGLSTWMLRALADELDRRNREWDERVSRDVGRQPDIG